MKKPLLFFLAVTFSLLSAYAQAPKKMNYQGAARDAQGNALINKDITLKMHIISGQDIDTPVYSEVQQTKTNSFGLFSLKIGDGDAINGSLDDIKWGDADHFISVELDIENNGHFQPMGINQLLSVPYAFYAERSGTAKNVENDDQFRTIPFGGTNGQTIHHNGTDWAASSLLFNNGTNAGVGTTSPSEKLDVNGNINISAGNELKIDGNRALAIDANRNFMQGYQTGNALTTGVNNNFLGYQAGKANTTGDNNAFIGYRAGTANTTGSENIFLGYRAGYSNTIGGSNFFAGLNAGYTSTSAINNISIGTSAGYSIDDGQNNVFVGREAGYNSNDNNNVFIGFEAGKDNTTGSGNTYIGYGADGSSPSLSNATAIGNGATVSASNSVVLGNGANVGIGTTAPISKLHVQGDVNLLGNVRIANGTEGNGKRLVSDATGMANWVSLSPHTTYKDIRDAYLTVNFLICLDGYYPPHGGGPGSGGAITPYTGQIIMFAGNYEPPGWAFCDGQILTISSNPALYSILGTMYGGNGITTFALPDMRSRNPVHEGTGPGQLPYFLGQFGGWYQNTFDDTY